VFSKDLLASCLIVLGLFLFLTGCKTTPGTTEIEIISAPIHEINISYAKSNPPQVLVAIKGGLPDGCTKFHDLKCEVVEKTIEIKVTIERPKGAVCPAIYGYFDQTVNLGSSFVRGDIYTVKVNDQITTFTMQ
jgi:hypothetical protein